MASLKKLAGQTIWYGLSNIAAKLLNYILTPLLTYLLASPQGQVDFGDVSVLYAAIAFANVLYTYGLETAYFRFSGTVTDRVSLFRTTFSSLLVSTLLFSLLAYIFRDPLSSFLGLTGYPEYIMLCAAIIGFDTLSAIPFARLRQEERPRKYAFVKVAGIVINILLTVFFIYYSPGMVKENPDSAYAAWYRMQTNVGLLLLANLAQAMVTFVLLWNEWKDYRARTDKALLGRILSYSGPMLIAGLGGMVNETIDRIMLRKLMPGSEDMASTAVGIYSANYKLAIFITLFIQAFRMGAEPFFFRQAAEKNAPHTYARVMKWFVITLCIAFLFTALYLDIWQLLLGKPYREGAGVVPILLGANVALGIYYNLSVWYKITDRVRIGMYITLLGAAITLIINYSFIPQYGWYACAWATFACYSVMMVLSYALGQRYFPVPYDIKRIAGYLLLMVLLFAMQKTAGLFLEATMARAATGTLLMGVFLGAVYFLERKELRALPLVGRFIR
ncbi:MAG: polysaccharide biosynthesis protein [Sphingobacteriales bacterium]|nr:MAG: polysaccharide biosynthesis protein [Sphingobacteriales bacterium]